MRLPEIDILETWAALGGGPLRGKRGKAFWRDGDSYNIALDAAKGTWYDHRDGHGGGVLALVETALGCDRRDALAFLETHCGLDPHRPLTPQERRAQAAAPALAKRLSDFARGLEILSERPLATLSSFLEENAIDPTEALAAFHRCANSVKRATSKDLAEAWGAMPAKRDAVERVGRADREHAETITLALVDLLVRAQGQERGVAA